jgi:hypothetical protein
MKAIKEIISVYLRQLIQKQWGACTEVVGVK